MGRNPSFKAFPWPSWRTWRKCRFFLNDHFRRFIAKPPKDRNKQHCFNRISPFLSFWRLWQNYWLSLCHVEMTPALLRSGGTWKNVQGQGMWNHICFASAWDAGMVLLNSYQLDVWSLLGSQTIREGCHCLTWRNIPLVVTVHIILL